ncbi:hypothetical protein LOTGIDRAFT_172729 [Lottia gigantea]|uniref:CUB domain-containing protein n=1 Tax=Lottia gigantea TaxID=225164 RepID=V4B5D2_LOTGI|nr:hypothetical protein LOTGIDRAFT_172729 [Lottia gigantea]ESP01202.1 hypothetical protein LOTGIDRAFT_172729 [Lottia gigantea]
MDSLNSIVVHRRYDPLMVEDEKSVENVCSGTVRKLQPTNGIILSPGFTEHTASASSHCYWSIDPFPATRVRVIVHLAYHKESMPNCKQKFLQIQFTGCNAGRIEKGSFCDIRKNNLEILSCGSVYISSLVSSNQPDFSDKFLISYEVTDDASISTFDGSAAETCGSFIQVSPTSIPSIASQEVINTPDNTIETKSQTKDESQIKYKKPIHILRKLKMMFLYIFFGLVIVALVISLVMVIISYKRMGHRGRYRRDASEKVVLVRKDDSPPRNKEETPMQTIRNTNTVGSNVSSSTPDGGDVSPTHYDVLVPTNSPNNTVIATIHLRSDEDKRLSAGSGFSSFRPSNRNSDISSVNPYASYSSLNSNNSPQYYGRTPAPSTQQYVHSNGQKRYISPVRNSERQPLFRHSASPATSDDVDHFTINEDDYAIVKKPIVNKKQENDSDREPTYDNIHDRDVGRFRPTSGPYDKNRTSTEINFQFQPPSHIHDDDL